MLTGLLSAAGTGISGGLGRAGEVALRAQSFRWRHRCAADWEREQIGVEADLACGRRRLVHAELLAQREEDVREGELFERSADLPREIGEARGEGEVSFWIGMSYQVARDDTATAVPFLEHSYALAESVGDKLTLPYAARHPGYADLDAGRLNVARVRFEGSARLRLEARYQPRPLRPYRPRGA